MQKLTITGKVHSISNVEEIGKNFIKMQRLRIDCTENPEYPNMPEFQVLGNRTSLLSSLKIGETVNIGFTVEGRDFEKDGKRGVITNLNIIEIGRIKTEFIKVEEEIPVPAPTTPVPAEKEEIF